MTAREGYHVATFAKPVDVLPGDRVYIALDGDEVKAFVYRDGAWLGDAPPADISGTWSDIPVAGRLTDLRIRGE